MDEIETFFIKSKKKLTLAKIAYDLEDYSNAVSSAYYAMFLVAKALVLKKGIKSPKTHVGLIHVFNLNYVHKDNFSYEVYKYLTSTQPQREDADYDAFDEITEIIARKRIRQAEEFIEEGKKFL